MVRAHYNRQMRRACESDTDCDMLGYGLIIACGLAMTIEAVVGYILAVRSESWKRRRLLKGVFLAFSALGLAAMIWGDWRIWFARQDGEGVADVEMSNTTAEIQLQRIAAIVGADPHARSVQWPTISYDAFPAMSGT